MKSGQNGKIKKYSRGLSYKRYARGKSMVSGTGFCSDGDVVIPAKAMFSDPTAGIAENAFKDEKYITSEP